MQTVKSCGSVHSSPTTAGASLWLEVVPYKSGVCVGGGGGGGGR